MARAGGAGVLLAASVVADVIYSACVVLAGLNAVVAFGAFLAGEARVAEVFGWLSATLGWLMCARLRWMLG